MMRKTIISLFIIIASASTQAQNFDELNFSTDTTFEVATWNIEWFPKNGQTTINYVSQIIDALDVDLLAVQEIDDKAKFGQMVEDLPGWDAYFLYGEYQSLAYIYKSSTVEMLNVYEVFTEDWREFPRAPLVIELLYENVKFIVIDNHFKCCGDGEMNLLDEWDEETRRYDASNLLDDLIRSDFPDDNLILLGDLNDILTDSPDNNVFKVFLDHPDEYFFADMEIAEGFSSGWSFPNWPSHLDHIMITNELFYMFWEDGTEAKTIKLDEFFPGGMNEYDEMVSDHRPVAIKFPVPESFGMKEGSRLDHLVGISPNPASNYISIKQHESISIRKLELYTGTGKKLIEQAHGFNRMDVSSIPSGLHLLLIYTESGIVSKKIMIR